MGTRHVGDAAKTKELIAFLEEVVAKLGAKAGKPLVEPKAQSAPPVCAKGSLVLHLTVCGLGGGTVENSIAHAHEKVKKLLPAGPWTPAPGGRRIRSWPPGC